MEPETDDVIAISGITMRFLVDGKATDGHMAMAEMMVQPQALFERT
jgi:hypothetical protein